MRIRFILGDQLNETISSLDGIDKEHDVVFMCEVKGEATHVKHHKKKIAFIFSAMRHFAQQLQHQGYNVHYVPLDAPDNTHHFTGELKRFIATTHASEIIITEPSEYRVLQEVKQWSSDLLIPVTITKDRRFLCTKDEFGEWASGKKQLLMEYFYRHMRKKYSVLMHQNKPVGGKWNYDSDNRKPPTDNLNIPAPYINKHDPITEEVISLVSNYFGDHFGDLDPFYFAVTRQQALDALDYFIATRLHQFGDYQDAMVQDQPWMYHSHISFYLNVGLLLPFECIEKAERAYRENNAPLNSVEGFIRQILGWREYVRGIYWHFMPEYQSMNALDATRKLPEFYWTGDTYMNCISQCVQETKQNAYAHHIQRLMVLGNFALIAGIAPSDVNQWYMIVYADAFEWVELPNVSGMILFADGGKLGSKPYAASGAYIHKMSNYCKQCHYSPTIKNGPKACPFNYLYWDFIITHQERLKDNHRMAMIYRSLTRMKPERLAAVKYDTRRFFNKLERHEKV